MKYALLKVIISRRMLVAGIMGFSAGLPLLLTISLLQARMTKEGVDLTVIGLMALVGLPYTLKFVWAPLMDRFAVPFFGRRRGWLLISQLLLVLAIIGLGLTPSAPHTWAVALAALAVTFFSASQDIVIDAYRREDLADAELGLGASLYVVGYRLGMWVVGGGAFILADYLSFATIYFIMAACMLPGLIATLLTPEPNAPFGVPRSIREAAIEPFKEYFARRDALWILGFILLYKLGDIMASAMTTPFYLETGFSMTEIGVVVKTFGAGAVTIGGLIGGGLMLKLGISRSLWIFGGLQALSTAGFVLLAQLGHNLPALAAVIAFENLCAGMGTAAYLAFMASITNQKFTATQYALLSSLMGIPRVIASAGTGYLAQFMGWPGFFLACTLVAIPGMLLLFKFAPWRHRSTDRPIGRG
jgi:PAT family beta-lactamase induction signal transducer AmpG